jgi:hypothetical protein
MFLLPVFNTNSTVLDRCRLPQNALLDASTKITAQVHPIFYFLNMKWGMSIIMTTALGDRVFLLLIHSQDQQFYNSGIIISIGFTQYKL